MNKAATGSGAGDAFVVIMFLVVIGLSMLAVFLMALPIFVLTMQEASFDDAVNLLLGMWGLR